MKGLPFVLLFTSMTFVAWGAYGPTLHHGANALQHDSLRAFVGVGLAYFLIAVIIPFMILKRSGEVGRWTVSGTVYSLVAGAVGAIGALGILLALGYGGSPIYVMPLVFGFAPVVNTLVTAFLSRTFNQISPIFIAGVVTAALGAVGVLTFKPGPAKSPPAAAQVETSARAVHLVAAKLTTAAPDDSPTSAEPPAADPQASDPVTSTSELADTKPADGETTAAESSTAESSTAETPNPETPAVETPAVETPAVETSTAEKPTKGAAPIHETSQSAPHSSSPDTAHAGPPAKKPVDFWGVLGSIVVAAFCWGSYGPMLHIGQGKMSGSRLRPFACVGMAYFLIAVAAPLAMIYMGSSGGGGFAAMRSGWTLAGISWSFVAGVAGAVGALGVILAFNAGGKPYYVMPLIFGFAPVINTFISVSEAGTWNLVPIMFWVSLAVVIAGAVTVLINAPKPKPHKAA